MSASNVKKLETNDEVIQEVGVIVETADDDLVVETSSGRFHCKRAVSCLVEPAPGDEVLFAGKRSGGLYILAVLERDGEEVTRLKLDGDVALQVKDGRFVVAAGKGVDLVTSRDISLTSSILRMRAAEGNVFFEKLTYLGKKVFAEADQAKAVFGVFDSVVERFSQRVKRAYRFVEELDQLRAEQVDYASKNNMRLRGRNALVSADLLVKIDGDQIHLG